MSSDHVMISNLLNEYSKPKSFLTSQWNRISDSNQGAYNNGGNLQFNTATLRGDWIDYHNAYLCIPISVTRPVNAFVGSEVIAWKASVLSCISAISVEQNGKSVVNDRHIHYINNLRLLLEKNVQWVQKEGPELHYHKQDNVPSVTPQFDGYKYIEPAAPVYGGTTNDAAAWTAVETVQIHPHNPFKGYNEGLNIGASYFRGDYAPVGLESGARVAADSRHFLNTDTTVSTTQVPAATYGWDMIIPLRFLHDYFMQLAFPIIGSSFLINVTFSNTAEFNAGYQPFQIASAIADQPTYAIRGPTYLYYRKVSFNSEDLESIKSMIADGSMTKTIRFLKHDFFEPNGLTPLANNDTNIGAHITSSSLNPSKVFVLMQPDGQKETSVNSSLVFPGHITTCNLLVNNTPLFQQDITTFEERWQYMKEHLLTYVSNINDSQISKQDYLRQYDGLFVFDLEKYGSHVLTKNASTELVFRGSRDIIRAGRNIALDVSFIVERFSEVKLFFDSSKSVEVLSA